MKLVPLDFNGLWMRFPDSKQKSFYVTVPVLQMQGFKMCKSDPTELWQNYI